MSITKPGVSRAISDTPYLEALHRLASSDPNVICITCSDFARNYLESSPSRVPQSLLHLPNNISAAIAFCAGLATEGYKPFLHAGAAAISRAGYEAILCLVSAPKLPVRLVGFDPSLAHSGGVAGQAIDDLSLLDLPNMTIAEPGDAQDLLEGLPLLNEVDGPIYLRTCLGGAPRLFDGAPSLNEPRILSEGGDLLVLSSGQCTAEILRLTGALERARVSMTHLHLFSIKPWPKLSIERHILAHKYKGAITIEAHLARGAMGTLLTEQLSDLDGLDPFPLYRLGLQDTFAQGGRREYLFKKYGIDVGAFLAAVETILKRKLGISSVELPPSPWHHPLDFPPIR